MLGRHPESGTSTSASASASPAALFPAVQYPYPSSLAPPSLIPTPSTSAAMAPDAPPPKKGAKANKAGGAPAKKRASAAGDKDKERKTRSRAACVACKSTKQRCDGPARIPCRRCELYGLECKFPTSANIIVYPPPPQSAAGSNDAGAVPGSSGENSGLVAQKLFEIAARLQSIESALHVQPGGFPSSPNNPSSHSQSQAARSPSPGSSDDGMDQDGLDGRDNHSDHHRNNPIQIINESVDQVVGIVGKLPALAADMDYGSPDVLKRGVLTADECQELFEFFFASIHPWVMMLSLDEDRDAMGVRSRSSLLFHTVLLLSTSYSTPFPSQLHTTLITFTNSILAPQILSPQPHELTTDFLRAIDLLNLYKPTQLSARRGEGKDDAEAMRASKVNGLASWMLQGILARTAERLELSTVLNKFSRAYSASSTGAPIPAQIVRDLRLYFWLLSNDVHGNVQSGRRCNMEGGAALTTTRLFSSLQLQPYDTRLAASVEMFEVARPILRSSSYERTRRISRSELDRYNNGMKVWEEFWIPVLIQQLPRDPLAMSVLAPFSLFITLTYNASCYVSWRQNRMYSSDSGGEATSNERDQKPFRRMRADGARGLSEWEFHGLQKCVEAAEALIFTLSEESRVRGAWRKVQWSEAERSDGWRKLVMDQSVVELSRWGMDAITCINFVYPLVFLCRLVSDGILSADLVLLHHPVTQPPFLYTQKLPRLLELGAAFLDAIASSPAHPAKAQAQLIRQLLDAGAKGHPATPPEQLPRHAGTVMSPGTTVVQYGGPPPPGQAPPLGQPWRGGGTSEPNQAAMIQYQQQHQQQLQLQQRQQMGPPVSMGGSSSGNVGGAGGGGSAPGMDEALSVALNGFDPLFGQGSAFWEWNGNTLGAAGMAQTELDWGTIGADLARP